MAQTKKLDYRKAYPRDKNFRGKKYSNKRKKRNNITNNYFFQNNKCNNDNNVLVNNQINYTMQAAIVS